MRDRGVGDRADIFPYTQETIEWKQEVVRFRLNEKTF